MILNTKKTKFQKFLCFFNKMTTLNIGFRDINRLSLDCANRDNKSDNANSENKLKDCNMDFKHQRQQQQQQQQQSEFSQHLLLPKHSPQKQQAHSSSSSVAKRRGSKGKLPPDITIYGPDNDDVMSFECDVIDDITTSSNKEVTSPSPKTPEDKQDIMSGRLYLIRHAGYPTFSNSTFFSPSPSSSSTNLACSSASKPSFSCKISEYKSDSPEQSTERATPSFSLTPASNADLETSDSQCLQNISPQSSTVLQTRVCHTTCLKSKTPAKATTNLQDDESLLQNSTQTKPSFKQRGVSVFVRVYRNSIGHFAVISRDELQTISPVNINLRRLTLMPGDQMGRFLLVGRADDSRELLELETPDPALLPLWLDALHSVTPPSSPRAVARERHGSPGAVAMGSSCHFPVARRGSSPSPRSPTALPVLAEDEESD